MGVIENFLSSGLFITKSDSRYRKVFLINIIVGIAVIILTFYILYNLLFTKLYLLAGMETVSLFAVFLSFYLLRYHQKVELSGSIIIWTVFILTIFFISERRHQDYAIIQAIFLPMIAIVLKGKKIGLIYSAFYLFLIAMIAFSGIDKWGAAQFTATSFINVLVTFIFIIALIYYYELSHSEIYHELDIYKNNLIDKVSQTLAEKRDQEQMLIQQSKMAAMGEMLGAITHQWKQPLSVIPAIITQIKMDLHTHDNHPLLLDDHLDNLLKQVDYMSQTSKDFTNFFKPSQHNEAINIWLAIKDVLLLLDNRLHRHAIKVNVEIEDKGLMITGKRNEFLQVLLNIVGNAIDAIVAAFSDNILRLDEGLITISTKNEAGKISLKITDNGGGIPADLLGKIFDPYFTTKQESQGSGIGLYMAKMIIESKMSARLYATNTNQGACFECVF